MFLYYLANTPDLGSGKLSSNQVVPSKLESSSKQLEGGKTLGAPQSPVPLNMSREGGIEM